MTDNRIVGASLLLPPGWPQGVGGHPGGQQPRAGTGLWELGTRAVLGTTHALQGCCTLNYDFPKSRPLGRQNVTQGPLGFK